MNVMTILPSDTQRALAREFVEKELLLSLVVFTHFLLYRLLSFFDTMKKAAS
jgi:hypothetical protein